MAKINEAVVGTVVKKFLKNRDRLSKFTLKWLHN